MKFAVVGAGAIGAYMGALLSRAGYDVTLIARGAHMRAMQERGVWIVEPSEEFVVNPRVTDDPAAVGPVDTVLLTLKAHSLTEMAARIKPLLGPNTTVVSAQNGIPWWYFYRSGGDWDGLHLESVDPGGVIESHIESSRILGCVIYCATIITEPGVIVHTEGNRFPIGEPDGSRSERARLVSEALTKAGMKAPVRSDIRHDIWVKLMGNVTFNPISALTHATLYDITTCPETRDLAAKMMNEVQAICARLGVDLGISTEQRIAGAEKVGRHKTSMLQDVEAGKPMELEALMGAVVELGEKMGIHIPYIGALYACAKLLNQQIMASAEPA
ncbi:MAG TPA: 2-dehydropantoate 2-reductase [Blastocatellia bacterium]